jgi:hypothetical protein
MTWPVCLGKAMGRIPHRGALLAYQQAFTLDTMKLMRLHFTAAVADMLFALRPDTGIAVSPHMSEQQTDEIQTETLLSKVRRLIGGQRHQAFMLSVQ